MIKSKKGVKGLKKGHQSELPNDDIMRVRMP